MTGCHIATAREIMVTRLVTVRPELPIFRAMRILLRNRISGVPVTASHCSHASMRSYVSGLLSGLGR